MLKITWEPTVHLPPDDPNYNIALDRVTITIGDEPAVGIGVQRDPNLPIDLEPLRATLTDWLGRRQNQAKPPILMIHGFDFDPQSPASDGDDPYQIVYGYPSATNSARLSWLPLVGECNDEGNDKAETAIAFGWVSTANGANAAAAGWTNLLPFAASYQYAYVDLAGLAARVLAGVLGLLDQARVKVDIFAHSLGTRVFTAAVAALGGNAPMLRNAILLGGAQYCVDAAHAFDGAAFNVINIGNACDLVLILGAQAMGDPSRLPNDPTSLVLGLYGLGDRSEWTPPYRYPPNWVDIALDNRTLRNWFQTNYGFHLNCVNSDNVHSTGWLHHWCYYTELGNRALLQALLQNPGMNGGLFANEPGFPAGMSRDAHAAFVKLRVPPFPMTLQARQDCMLNAIPTGPGVAD